MYGHPVAAAAGMLIAGGDRRNDRQRQRGHQPVRGGNDGNTVVSIAGNKDWLSAPGVNVVIQTDQDTGQCDNSFTQGSKEDETNVVIGLGSIPNSRPLASSAWDRDAGQRARHDVSRLDPQQPVGYDNFDFEINQVATQHPIAPPGSPDAAIVLYTGDGSSNTDGGDNIR